MKENLFTIPVNEALAQDEECLFCTLNKKLEQDIINYVLGPSYMEEDVRCETDKIGFCKKHYSQMYNAQNRLGLALIIDTHLKNVCTNLNNFLNDDAKAKSKKSFLKTDKKKSKSFDYLSEVDGSCYACQRMEERMNSYVNTYFYLFKKDNDFREKIKASKGYCLKHFNMLLDLGKDTLSPDSNRQLIDIIIPLEIKNLEILQNDLDWFIQKFDYRFTDAPWKNSESSLPRSILKLSSEFVED